MRWKSAWWGVTIIAESDEDKELLDTLASRLPEEISLFDRYEDGEMTKETGPDGEFCIVFRR